MKLDDRLDVIVDTEVADPVDPFAGSPGRTQLLDDERSRPALPPAKTQPDAREGEIAISP